MKHLNRRRRLSESSVEFDIYDFCNQMARSFAADESYVNDDRYVILKRSDKRRGSYEGLTYEKIAIGPIEPPVRYWDKIVSVTFRGVDFDERTRKSVIQEMEQFVYDVAKVAEMNFRRSCL